MAPRNSSTPLPRSSLLKVPRQPRSVAMIHRILDSAMELLVDEGSASFTANRVAERAGISPGSLYQYFANKEMIIAGVIERALISTEHVIQAAFGMSKGAPIEDLLLQVFNIVTDKLERYRPVVREIFTGVPLLSETSVPSLLERSFMDAIRNYLLLNQDEVRLEGGMAAMYVSVNSAIFMFLKWMVDQPPHFSRDDFFAALIKQVASPIHAPTKVRRVRT